MEEVTLQLRFLTGEDLVDRHLLGTYPIRRRMARGCRSASMPSTSTPPRSGARGGKDRIVVVCPHHWAEKATGAQADEIEILKSGDRAEGLMELPQFNQRHHGTVDRLF